MVTKSKINEGDSCEPSCFFCRGAKVEQHSDGPDLFDCYLKATASDFTGAIPVLVDVSSVPGCIRERELSPEVQKSRWAWGKGRAQRGWGRGKLLKCVKVFSSCKQQQDPKERGERAPVPPAAHQQGVFSRRCTRSCNTLKTQVREGNQETKPHSCLLPCALQHVRDNIFFPPDKWNKENESLCSFLLGT